MKAINHKLQQTAPDGLYDLWLVTSADYADAPKKRTDNQVNSGTSPPVQPFESPFAGKTIEDCADWIKNAPDDVDFDRRFFGVLNERSKPDVDDTIMVCRIGDGFNEGKKDEVHYFPCAADRCSFGYIPPGDFDERLQGYKRLRLLDKKPDLSRGEPFNGPGYPDDSE